MSPLGPRGTRRKSPSFYVVKRLRKSSYPVDIADGIRILDGLRLAYPTSRLIHLRDEGRYDIRREGHFMVRGKRLSEIEAVLSMTQLRRGSSKMVQYATAVIDGEYRIPIPAEIPEYPQVPHLRIPIKLPMRISERVFWGIHTLDELLSLLAHIAQKHYAAHVSSEKDLWDRTPNVNFQYYTSPTRLLMPPLSTRLWTRISKCFASIIKMMRGVISRLWI